MATIYPREEYNAEEAAEILNKSMKGLGTDEKMIIKLLVCHNNRQRQEIKDAFITMFGKSLEDELKSELSGDFEDVILALMTPPRLYDAKCLKKAVKGLGTDEATLIEILVTRTNFELEEIKAIYEEEYKTSLEKDVKDDTSGHFRRLLISLINLSRDESDYVDYGLAEMEALEIYEKGEAQLVTDESAISRILAQRNWAQLRATFDAYKKIADKDISEAIKIDTTGDLEDAYQAIVQYARDPAGFFATKAYKSMKGLGTNDTDLIRIIVTRSEIDLAIIKAAFAVKYKDSLVQFVKDDTSGDYKRALVAILGD